MRDARIAPIYEGTNGIQAITLVRRGLQRDQGAAVASLLAEIEADVPALGDVVKDAERAAAWLRQADARNSEAGAHAFLQLIGTLTAAWLCTRVTAHKDAPPAAAAAAQVFIDQVLPRARAFAASIAQPSAAIVGDLELA